MCLLLRKGFASEIPLIRTEIHSFILPRITPTNLANKQAMHLLCTAGQFQFTAKFPDRIRMRIAGWAALSYALDNG